MPTYTYRCKECEHQFDLRQSFSDDPLTECPDCGADNGLRKVVNSVGIVFKGSGFYVTDNANGKGKVSLPANSSGDTPDSSDTKTTKADSASNSTSTSEKSGSSEKSNGAKEKKSAS